ncbi:hypothetical protein KIW84_055604 [Lathyrus oleraceus]|uniref:Retrovirus-related Pol polyprotein from transposon TNT 1-94-like beta-barrel domain-containing protein n=1 Tax=Pisum sativum TaxID=3888 RepID=A0A9D5AFZ6_PEA|nr:hypothetical protein KIW84_055604 [Pisum sativum]
MSGRKDWFVNIKSSMTNMVKFANVNTLAAEGVGVVLIMRKDDKRVSIEDKMMRVLDSNGRFILKAPMSQNRTFKIELNMMEHECLAITANRDEQI